MRICMVIPRYYPIFGGAETQAKILIRALRATRRVEVPLLITHRLREDLAAQEVIDGVPVLRVGEPGISQRQLFGFLFSVLAALWRHRREYDLIHVHATSVIGFLCAAFGRFTRKPVILKLSTNGELSANPRAHPIKRAIRQKMARFTARWATIVALNAEGYREAQDAGCVDAALIPNGLDFGQYRPAGVEERAQIRADLGIRPDQTVILFVGRFTARKGLDLLIPAFQSIRAEYPRAVLALAGSSELQDEASGQEAEAAAARSPDQVRLWPPKNPAIGYYQAADIFVSPSRREGMPNVVLEALGVGLPCVLSDIEPHREMRDQNPRARIHSFRSEDSGDLGRAMRQALDDQATLSPSLDESFRIESIAGRYIERYARLLETR